MGAFLEKSLFAGVLSGVLVFTTPASTLSTVETADFTIGIRYENLLVSFPEISNKSYELYISADDLVDIHWFEQTELDYRFPLSQGTNVYEISLYEQLDGSYYSQVFGNTIDYEEQRKLDPFVATTAVPEIIENQLYSDSANELYYSNIMDILMSIFKILVMLGAIAMSGVTIYKIIVKKIRD